MQVYDPKTGTYKEQIAPKSVSFGFDDPTMLPKAPVVGSTVPVNSTKTAVTQAKTTTPKFRGLDVAKTTDQATRGFIPKTTSLTPTKTNPVIVQEPKPTQVGGVDYSQIDNMDTNSLQRYVDERQVKATMGEEIPTDERMKLLAASRKLATITSPVTVANPYEAQIKTQEQQRAEREAQLKAQEEAMMSAEERRLNAVYAERQRQTQEAGQRQATAGQQAMSFSGLGRSTFNADQQSRIQQSVEANLAALNEEKFTALERYRAEQAGATAESLAGYDQRINQLKDKQAQFQLQQAEQINKFNQESATTYQEKINNLMQYAQSWKDPNAQLTEQELATAKAYGQIAIDKDGNINTALLKEIDPKLMSEVIKSAAEARGAIPTNEFGFINVGGGMVAITDPVTGKVRYEQGQVPKEYKLEKIGDTGYAFDPTTGQATQIAGKITATGDLRGLASQYPGQAWAKNNNPGGLTWGVSQGLKDAWTAAGIDFGQGTPRPSGEGGNYISFNTIEDGLAAQRIALSRDGGDINARLQKWVGTGEGPDYAKQVMGLAGLPNGIKFEDLTDEQAQALQKAIIKKESPGLYKLLESSKSSTQGGYTPLTKEEKSTLFSIQDDLKADPRRKEYLTLSSKIKTLEGIKTRLDAGKATAQDKQQLISDFAKVLDPTSVVRTEEYALAAKYGQSAINKTIQEISNWYDTNGPLSNTSAKVLAEAVGLRYEAAKLSNDEAVEEQKKRAEIFLGRPVSYDELAVTKSQAPVQTIQQSNIPAALANPNQPQGEQPTQAELDLINSL